MKIQYSPYKLTPKSALNAKSTNMPRSGFLLRVEFENIGVGYADCFPWPELGDATLDDQLSSLAKNDLTPLTKKSLYFAKIDAIHRKEKQSVFLNKSPLKSHLINSYDSITPEEITKIKMQGFQFLKLKFGKNVSSEIEFIKINYLKLKELNLKLRLDFNSVLSFQESMNFFREIQPYLNIIDFVEDPCEYNFDTWSTIQQTFQVNLALDRKNNTEVDENMNAFKVIIIKPALEDIQNYFAKLPKQRIIFTSYMDHPLGQLCAIYEASNFYAKFPEKMEHCGFLTHPLYEENLYSTNFKIEDAILKAEQGTGFGFDNLLKMENWISI